MVMPIKAELVERTSQKGNKFICIEVSITDKIKKLVFLNNAELELIRLNANNK